MDVLRNICREFGVSADIDHIEPYGTGHIHDTYRVASRHRQLPGYLLQRINTRVFPDPAILMENIRVVTEYLQGKLEEEGGSGHQPGLQFLPGRHGKYYITDPDGGCWRMCYFIPGSIAIASSPAGPLVREHGRAFGKFIHDLSGLPHDALKPVIPEFHDLQARLDRLHAALSKDVVKRAALARDLIETVGEAEEGMLRLEFLRGENQLPIRTCHNDTKIDNVLFSKERTHFIAVIDLDTVGPGIVHYDFGDALRTCASTAQEDEADLARVDFDLSRFSTFADGFCSEAGPLLTAEEWETLHLSPAVMAYIMAVRFLTDFLDGDRYFKVRDGEHNRRRAAAQMRLVERIEAGAEVLRDVIAGYSRTYSGAERARG